MVKDTIKTDSGKFSKEMDWNTRYYRSVVIGGLIGLAPSGYSIKYGFDLIKTIPEISSNLKRFYQVEYTLNSRIDTSFTLEKVGDYDFTELKDSTHALINERDSLDSIVKEEIKRYKTITNEIDPFSFVFFGGMGVVASICLITGGLFIGKNKGEDN